MNPSGKSAGGGSKGGKCKGGKGGGGDVVKQSYALQTAREHMLTLHKALQTDEGKDRDVTQAYSAFLTYQRNGLDVKLAFATGGKLAKAQLRAAKMLVDRQAKDALNACGITLEDKVADLKDAAARHIFVYGAAPDADTEPPVLGFAHFRFTLQGELLEAMEGEPVLLVADLFLAPEVQRKGLGSHVMNLLQLVARGTGMSGVMVAAYTALPAAHAFLSQKQKGFALDAEWTPEAEAGLTVYYKPLKAPPAAASPVALPAAASPVSSPDSVLSPPSGDSPGASPVAPVAAREAAAPGVALAAQFERAVSVQDAASAASPAEVPFWARVAPPTVPAAPPAAPTAPAPAPAAPAAPAPAEGVHSDAEDGESDAEDSSEEEEENDDERADRILDELAEMFEARHGRPPTAEEVDMWKATLAEAADEQ